MNDQCDADLPDLNATQQRAADHAALQESESRYRALVEWTPEAVAVHRAGRLLYVNPATIKLFGAQSAQELVGKPLLQFVHPDFHQIAIARVKSITEQGVSGPLLQEKLLKLDGSPLDVGVKNTLII